MRKIFYSFIIPVCLFGLLGCGKNQATVDQQIIQSYISSHHLNAIQEPGGLYFVSTQTGTGANPTATSEVTVTYKGYYTDGTVFDQSNTAVSFYLDEVIAGWTEGIPLMKVGGKATLLIPSALAYGQAGSGSVPPNTVLIFDVNLLRIQ
jgi:FKBP-type peptidyl-prolyl cis-trans isomerase FkpA